MVALIFDIDNLVGSGIWRRDFMWTRMSHSRDSFASTLCALGRFGLTGLFHTGSIVSATTHVDVAGSPSNHYRGWLRRLLAGSL